MRIAGIAVSQADLDSPRPGFVPLIVSIIDKAGVVDQVAIKGAEAVIQSLKSLADISAGELLPTRGCSIDFEEFLSGQRSQVESQPLFLESYQARIVRVLMVHYSVMQPKHLSILLDARPLLIKNSFQQTLLLFRRNTKQVTVILKRNVVFDN